MPFILGANSVSGYTVKNSLRFNSASTDYLNRTFSTPTNNKIWTWSCWIKRATLGQNFFFVSRTTANSMFQFTSGDKLSMADVPVSTYNYRLQTTQVFRDVSAWYHILLSVDTTQATSSNRLKLYVNGSQITSFEFETQPTQNFDTDINSANVHRIGTYDASSSLGFNGYMSEFNFIDGQALTPSSFGETDTDTGIWKPKAYTGTYGTNGFYLKFANSASLGTDSSGNGNNFTVNNLTSIDQTTDTPTNNFCTANPLNNGMGGTFTEGNLVVTNASATDKAFGATIGMTSGKWYWEVKPTTLGDRNGIGILDISYNTFSATASSNYAFVFVGNGSSGTSGSITGTVPSFSVNDIICFAFDADNGKLYFSKNSNLNTSTATYFTITASTYTAGVRETGATVGTNSFNFGSPQYTANGYTDGAGYGNFSYQVPANYFSLCTKNLATYG